VTADPFKWLTSWRGRLVEDHAGPCEADPFAALQGHLSHWRTETAPDLPPFQGGAAGLFGYDLCHHVERLPRPERDEFQTPDLAIGLYDWVLAIDHEQRRAWLFSTGLPQTGRARERRARARLRWVKNLIADRGRSRPPDVAAYLRGCIDPGPCFPLPKFPGVTSNFDRPDYLAIVRRAIEYTHAGDCFQVNVSQRLLREIDRHPLFLYRDLRECNPAPFAGYFDLGDFAIVSASPERFLHVANGDVETRPIKGTRPRGATPEEDLRQIDDLLRSAKDRAENIMIVDLLRNDLGRVCAYGSVRVPAVCRLETYEHVHHLVSEVRGRLRPGLTPVDLLRAAFPGGSVTGAPKVRAMEIIAELEPTARGPYCGSLGYIGFDGSMDSNILIRTFTVGRGWMQFPVGGGIVADSDPDDEYAETLHKAEGLLRALGGEQLRFFV
jgi:para-aminobenzoate synthetase component 1